MDLYLSRQPTFERWYGCITSELNAIVLTGFADKPVPTAFPSQTGHLDARPFGNSKFLMLLLPQIHFWLSAPYNAYSFITKRSFPCILPARNASRNCTTTNIAPPRDFKSGVQLRHMSVELKAQAVGLSARGISLATYLLNEWVCTILVHMHCRKKKHSCLICQEVFPHHRAESASTSGEWPAATFPTISKTAQSTVCILPSLPFYVQA